MLANFAVMQPLLRLQGHELVLQKQGIQHGAPATTVTVVSWKLFASGLEVFVDAARRFTLHED